MTFEDTLATWLVKQRWFAGKGRTVHDLAVVADTEIIPGDPGMRHLMVTVSHGATSDCYQLFIGYRAPRSAPRTPPSVSSATAPVCRLGCGTPGSAQTTGCRSTTGCATRR